MNPISQPDPNLLKGNLDLILLMLLEEGPKYGLEIIKEAEVRTDGYFEFREGSLYPALHRLEKAGWVRAEFQPSDTGGARRRYYQLTDKGVRELGRKRAEMKTFMTALGAIGKGI